MDIEKLTKVQVILLTLLVSFVTSIATGIVTVTLLDQAPPAITRTINKVVERTIERVIPDPDNQSASVVTKEVTVVVKEEDLITESIERNTSLLGMLYRYDGPEASTSTPRTFIANGLLTLEDGTVLVDSESVSPGKYYTLVNKSGTEFTMEAFAVEEDTHLSVIAPVVEEGASLSSFPQATFTDLGALKLGQTVIALSGEDQIQVAMGVIAGLQYEDVVIENEDEESEEPPATKKVLSIIDTTIVHKSMIPGSPLINMFGEVIALYTDAHGFVPIRGVPTSVSIPNKEVAEDEEVAVADSE